MAPVSLNFQVYVFVSIRGRGWGDKTQTAVTSKKVQERKALVYHKSQAVGGGGGERSSKTSTSISYDQTNAKQQPGQL